MKQCDLFLYSSICSDTNADDREYNIFMKKELTTSGFKQLKGIEYFDFEEDFVEKNMRCIPMTVRFKMDATGIKLKLHEWSKFSSAERIALALKPAETNEEAALYNQYLSALIKEYTGNEASVIPVNEKPEWADTENIPAILQQKAKEFNINISIAQWQSFTNLQRFALSKLCRPGHENRNFPKAIVEFGLVR